MYSYEMNGLGIRGSLGLYGLSGTLTTYQREVLVRDNIALCYGKD